MQKRYLHGPAVDQVLAQEDVTLTAGNADRVLWHLADNLGSTRDMLRSDGTTKAHLQYESFRNLIDGLEIQRIWPFRRSVLHWRQSQGVWGGV